MVSACYNVKINLGMLADPEKVAQLNDEVDEIMKQGQQIFEQNRDKIENELA